jgi:hypothetical protein
MTKTNTWENGILGLLFNAVAVPDIAENDTTAPSTNLYVSFHTADPGEAATQATNETTYGAYARVAVSRTTTGWKVTGNTVYPRANIAAPTPTSGSGTLTYFGVGESSAGAGVLYYSGAISPGITITTGGAPTLVTGTNITED